jgi:hypothetical protein
MEPKKREPEVKNERRIRKEEDGRRELGREEGNGNGRELQVKKMG